MRELFLRYRDFASHFVEYLQKLSVLKILATTNEKRRKFWFQWWHYNAQCPVVYKYHRLKVGNDGKNSAPIGLTWEMAENQDFSEFSEQKWRGFSRFQLRNRPKAAVLTPLNSFRTISKLKSSKLVDPLKIDLMRWAEMFTIVKLCSPGGRVILVYIITLCLCEENMG